MKAIVALGSNLEPRGEWLARALKRLAGLPSTTLVAASRARETEPVGVPPEFAELRFLNQVAIWETALEAHDFSRRMHAIEDELGRVRTVANGPRTIDLDLIAFGDLKLNEPELTLPHPRAAARDFVMEPLRELWLEELRRLYDGYVAGYRDAAGRLPEMMQLKYEHTMMVVRHAEAIVAGEGVVRDDRFAALAASLLHDTGRYEQLRLYNTFQDSQSVDHAVFSHDIVRSHGWLETCHEPWPWPDELSAAILAAVRCHNRREVPPELQGTAFIAAHVVRDADKLDIFRVLEDRVRHSDWRTDSRAFWNLQPGLPPSAEVIAAIRERRPVDYQLIRTLSDFVLIQIGWMISGLHFATSRRRCLEGGHLEFRRSFLKEIGGGAAADGLCDLAVRELASQHG